jgi:hypothetical protein
MSANPDKPTEFYLVFSPIKMTPKASNSTSAEYVLLSYNAM